MGKQKMTPIGIACILLVLLVVAFMVRGSLREPAGQAGLEKAA